MHTDCREMIEVSQRFFTAGEAERWASHFVNLNVLTQALRFCRKIILMWVTPDRNFTLSF